MYCSRLHAKYYSNENEALLTSLNLLGKSMINNIEYGITFPKSLLTLEKIYEESVSYTQEVVKTYPCIFVKRPVYKKVNLGLSKKYLESKVLYDVTDDLHFNRRFKEKFYKDFETELSDTNTKISREEYEKAPESKRTNQYLNKKYSEYGYCIRTGVKIPFNPNKPLCYEAYLAWAEWRNENYKENYCHRTGAPSNGKTSMANPILE